MVEFIISNEIFLGMMMLLIVPTVLYLNKIMTNLNRLITCFESQKTDYESHKKHSDLQEDKLNSISEKVSLHSIIISRLEDDVGELESERKGAPIR